MNKTLEGMAQAYKEAAEQKMPRWRPCDTEWLAPIGFQGDHVVIKPLLVFKRAEEASLPMSSTSAQRSRALDLLKARGMLRLKDFVAEGARLKKSIAEDYWPIPKECD